MPWNKRTLALPASPPSVRVAREWVAGVLREIGRDDLSESARLAVSELVTNAILHADPPMTVHVRGTVEHPRVEVTDQSLIPPQRRESNRLVEVDNDSSWPTMGRGLDLVASYSTRWGADISANGMGKVVWFEPSDGVIENPVEGEVFDMDGAIAQRAFPTPDPAEMLIVELVGLPVALFATLRRHFNEVSRELRLLSLTDGDRYPLAVEFNEAYLQVENDRRQSDGVESLDQAIRDEVPTADLVYSVPPTTPAAMERISALFTRVYDELTGDVLLSVRPPQVLLDLESWYFGEFARQAADEPPVRWDGPLRLELPARREVS